MCDHNELWEDLSVLHRKLATERDEREKLEQRITELEAKLAPKQPDSLLVDGIEVPF